MSRIQEILAKAEREGTTRRTRAVPAVADAPSPAEPFDHQDLPVTGGAEYASATVADPIAEAHDFVETMPFSVPVRPGAARLPAEPAMPAPAEGRAVQAALYPSLVAALDPHSAAAEQYRTVRTRIAQREEIAPVRTIAVTSPGTGEGRSTTAANLALTMAQEIQRRVVLVDCDFRGAAVHRLFGLEPGAGLAEVLSGDAVLDDVLIHVPECRLTILPAGAAPQFPTELLGSAAMRRTLDTLRSRFDRVILDVPAAQPLADAGTVAPMTDGVLMVVRSGMTQRPALDQALECFEQSRVLGIVLNDAQ